MLKITCNEAAKIMNVGGMYIRMGLRKGRLPFGTAVNQSGLRWAYHISAPKFAAYLGITLEQLEKELKQVQ